MDYRGVTVLITGASAGLGAEFARQLTRQGADLILVARSADRLEALAATLRPAVQVTVLPADLSAPGAVEDLIAEVRRRELRVDVLINNAGYGVFEDVLASNPSRQIGQVDVNVRALVALTQAFTPAMVDRRSGGVINVASTAAFQPLAGATIYAATKAFVLFFSEGLSLELDGLGVTVTAACPGPIATEFFADMNPRMPARQMAQPDRVVSDTLRGFERGRRIVYPGSAAVRLATLGARLLPRATLLRAAATVTRSLNQRHTDTPQ